MLILGGSEKFTDFSELLPALGGCRAVVCQGEAGPRIATYLEEEGWGDAVYRTPDLEAAFRSAEGLARSGDVILLSTSSRGTPRGERRSPGSLGSTVHEGP